MGVSYYPANLIYDEKDLTPEQHDELIALMKAEDFEDTESGYGYTEASEGELPEGIRKFFEKNRLPFSWEVSGDWGNIATIELFDGHKTTQWVGEDEIHMPVEDAFDVIKLMQAGEALKLHKRLRAASTPF